MIAKIHPPAPPPPPQGACLAPLPGRCSVATGPVRSPFPLLEDASMFIETEGTPNPATLKFLPGRDVMGAATADFAAAESAGRSPLAGALFALPGVARVFLGGDFITVTKTDASSWQALKTQVLAAVMDHFVAGRPVIEGAADEDLAEEIAPEDEEIVAQIK